jgi:hypothetical protein
MKEGTWLIASIVLYRTVSRPPEKHHKCHKNSRSGVNKFVQKSRSHLKSLGTKRVTRSMFHTEDPHTTGATLQNCVTQATWRPVFVHPCNKFTWNVEQRCEQRRRRVTRRAGSGPLDPLQTYGILTLVVSSFGRDYVLDTKKNFISLLWDLRGSPLKITEDFRLSTRSVAPDRGEEKSELKRHWRRFDDSVNHSIKTLEKHFK